MEDKNQNQKTTEIQKETEDKNTESDACKKQAEEYLNNWKRERADFVNYKKDEGKRMEEFVKFANESLILELLDVVDDLYLAAKQVNPVKSGETGTAGQLFDGVKNTGLEQVIKKFEDLLKKYGVEKIKVGDPVKSPDGDNGARKFDPMLHEIVEGTEGEKIEEVRGGYTMHGRVIRPTRVKIIK